MLSFGLRITTYVVASSGSGSGFPGTIHVDCLKLVWLGSALQELYSDSVRSDHGNVDLCSRPNKTVRKKLESTGST